MRETIKGLVARGSRTGVGTHLLHAATRPGVTAEGLGEVRAWSERRTGSRISPSSNVYPGIRGAGTMADLERQAG